MRLVLSLPETAAALWSRREPDRFEAGAATLTVGPMMALPDDVPAWVDGTLGAQRPPGAIVERGGLIERTTASGWRFRVVDARITIADRTTEVKMAAFYRFFEHVAAAVMRLPGEDPAPELARRAIEIFETATPDFSSQIVGLHQLWAG